ncbi:cytokine-dependent hematopoietic cell linker [Triplophysa dalaica]|uniref:cytokine-dependent hematopoietic cell linker n=1 Tax=Triplophysa dalaica TaxID=1582913 RepID=UPI0024DFA1A9|nr:cytokine-dependent hematopoietic cell linker [Triplophysa dalaica]
MGMETHIQSNIALLRSTRAGGDHLRNDVSSSVMEGINRLDRDRLAKDRYTDGRSPKNHVTRDSVYIPPRTVQPGCKGPVVNRDLKPGRRLPPRSDGRLPLLGSADRDFTVPQRPVRYLPRDQMSLPPLPTETISEHRNKTVDCPASRPVPNSPHNRNQNNTHTWTESGLSEIKNVKSRSSEAHLCQRLSLDLDSQDLSSDCVTEHNFESHFRRQQNHEWPPTKEDSHHSGFSSHSKPVQGLEEQNWYVGPFSRVDSEHALHLVNREGAFLVRDCSRNTTQEPFVLAVFYDKRVFNIQIRFCEDTCKYTLGTGLRNSERFDSVTDIIKFHSIFPIILIDGRKILAANNPRRHSVLMYPVTKQDMTELLR